MNKKRELYRGKAVTVKDEKQTIKALLKAVIFCLAVFAVSKYLPFAWAFEIGAIIASAVYINKIMKQGTFVATYILYEDTLVVLTRYGLIEKVTAEYELTKSAFSDNAVTYEGKIYPFYPDETLKTLLKIKIPS